MLSPDFAERILKVIADSNRIANTSIDMRDDAVRIALKARVPLSDIAAVLQMPEWSVQLLANRAEQRSPDPATQDA